ncbi:MAG TPA: hypothetical protein VLM91_27580 [Candidatus Methylomirabilis sp.]|nr:hypothetical protein [Candidatus Methylomirabilis sp.]
MRWAILDTTVYIGHWKRGLYAERLAAIRTVGDAQSWDTNKRRDFQNDTLIALTARRHGATVVTANRVDFELLSKKVGCSVLPL